MKISLPDRTGKLTAYNLIGSPVTVEPPGNDRVRIAFAAAHVVSNSNSAVEPSAAPDIDWDATLAFRRYLANLGLGIAEAMDTAQRGNGLDWSVALDLVARTRAELPDALIFNGVGTDQLSPGSARKLDDVVAAYLQQIEAVQKVGGRIIVMASRALANLANGPDEYLDVYSRVLEACDKPAILHWLGEMFDPALAGYWGSHRFEDALETALAAIDCNRTRVDGIKISLLDKDKEIEMRRRLPSGVRMYTGDDFNYPELIAGDDHGYSDALLGIFDAIAPAAATALHRLDKNDVSGFHSVLEPTVPLSRLIFRAPTQHYKTGVVFLAWLNGHQKHFIMVNGAQSMRPLPYFVECFKLADAAGLLRDPDLATARMQRLLALYGF